MRKILSAFAALLAITACYTRKQIAAEKKRCNSHNCAQAILHTGATQCKLLKGIGTKVVLK